MANFFEEHIIFTFAECMISYFCMFVNGLLELLAKRLQYEGDIKKMRRK